MLGQLDYYSASSDQLSCSDLCVAHATGDRNQERPATPSAGIYLEPVLEQAPSRHYEQLNPAVGDDVPNYDRLHTATPQRAQAQQSTAQDYETIR